MPEQPPAHTDRRRAESFGSAADEYDRHRPRYPRALVADLVAGEGVRALDVGAGTGIASDQLLSAGAQVLAIEPDARMARVTARSIVNRDEDGVIEMIEQCGFTTERRRVDERLHYSTEEWLNLVFTYSNHLALTPTARTDLRSRLEQRIGSSGVDARNDALAVICSLRR
jgi:hypothetical protein